MRKRILSLVLAIAMCFSMVSVVVTANDNAVLMEDFGDIVEDYKNRVWDWQARQFDAMTPEQEDVIADAYDAYEANKAEIERIAGELADELITDKMLSNETMKDLYKWKVMRDIAAIDAERTPNATSDDAAYQDWLERFTAFEKADDEKVTPSVPGDALDNLGNYSAELTEYFGELAGLVDNGLVLEGEGAAKVEAYVAAFDPNGDGNDEDDDMASIADKLRADVKELMVDGMVNAFDLGMQIAANKINTGLLGRILDRDMKGLFLIWGEEFTNFVVDSIPAMKSDLMSMNKEDVIEAMLDSERYGADVFGLLEGNNENVVNAMYGTMEAAAKYIADQEFSAEIVAEVYGVFGIEVVDAIEAVTDKLREAMDIIAVASKDGQHGLELVHFNTYMGRELLRYELEGELAYLKNAVISEDNLVVLEDEEEGSVGIELGYAHARYPSIENKLNGIDLTQFDVEGNENGITAKAGEFIGNIIIDVADDAEGSAAVNVYRGYSDGDMDGAEENVEDVYRYVATFTVEVEDDEYVNLDEIEDPSAEEGKVEVKGETNLDEVEIVVKDEEGNVVDVVIKDKDGNVLDPEHISKEDFEEGIEIELPEGVEPGDNLTVEVTKPGEDDVLDSDDFTVKEEEPKADATVDREPTIDDPTIDISGETNLDEVEIVVKDEEGNVVDVVIKDKDGNVLDPEHVSKEDFEEGIEIELPEGIEPGDNFTVEVKNPADDAVLDSETVTVREHYVDLEDVLDTTVDGTITVKGETNLDYVTVAIIKNGETIYAVVYSEAEFEAGITLNAPDGAKIGEVYTVVVGTELAADSDDFAIEGAVSEYYVDLEDVLDTTVDGTITVKGETNLDYVTVAIVKNGETIYAVVYSKAEFEAGITLNAPDGAKIGEVYTVVVGTELASNSDEFAITGNYVNLEDVQNPTLDGEVIIKGETNLDEVQVTVKDEDGNVIYDKTHTKEEFEEGIEIELPEGIEPGDNFTVEITKPGDDEVLAEDDFTVVDGPYVRLEDVLDTTVDGTITIKGTTNLENVTVSIVKGEETIYAVVYTKAEFEAGITLNAPDGAVIGDEYTVAVGTEEASDDDTFTIIGYYVNLDEIEDPSVEDGKVVVKGETNLDEVQVTVKDENGNVIYDKTHTKEELENGIEIELPEGVKPGDNFTVEVTKPGEDEVLDSDDFTVVAEPSLALAGDGSRRVKKGSTILVTTTPQNLPEGAVAEVVWTTEDGTIISVESLAGDYNNLGTIKGLKKGVTTLTATLYVNGVAVDSVQVKVTVYTSGGGGGVSSDGTEKVTVKVDETKDLDDVPKGGVKVEADKTGGNGDVEISIEDGKVIVTGKVEGTVTVTVKIYDENGKLISTEKYEITVLPADTVDKPHECEWPDIAAGWEGKANAHWAHLTIDIMTINGYIKGYPDGLFKPDQNITRAEFTAIVYRILGLEDSVDGVYYDDTKGHWAEEIIATMSLPEGYGMTRGYGDGNFGPNDFITREQAVAIIARAKSSVWVEAVEGAKDVFTDSEDISWWFDGEMDAAVTNGLITGYEDGSYKPLGFTTRAEACTLLARAWPEVLELN